MRKARPSGVLCETFSQEAAPMSDELKKIPVKVEPVKPREPELQSPVSYTHLTLPTKRIV